MSRGETYRDGAYIDIFVDHLTLGMDANTRYSELLAEDWVQHQSRDDLNIPYYLREFAREVEQELHDGHTRIEHATDINLERVRGLKDTHPAKLILNAPTFREAHNHFEHTKPRSEFDVHYGLASVMYDRRIYEYAAIRLLVHEQPDRISNTLGFFSTEDIVEEAFRTGLDYFIYRRAKYKKNLEEAIGYASYGSSDVARTAIRAALDDKVLKYAQRARKQSEELAAEIVEEHASSPMAREAMLGYFALIADGSRMRSQADYTPRITKAVRKQQRAREYAFYQEKIEYLRRELEEVKEARKQLPRAETQEVKRRISDIEQKLNRLHGGAEEAPRQDFMEVPPPPGAEELRPDKAVTLSDIGGLHHAKQALYDVATSFKHPEIMDKWGAKRPQGILLHGEPGGGKTMLVEALANEIGAELLKIQGTKIYDAWLGQSEQNIKNIFSVAKTTKEPLIIFFDEFESIVGITSSPGPGGGDSARNAVAAVFKQEMNTLAEENPKVLVVGATNHLDRIDPSLVRSGRFDYKIYVPAPDIAARQEIAAGIVARLILEKEREEFRVFAEDVDVAKIAAETDGFTGADIAEIFRRLSLSRARQEARMGLEQPPITQEEIMQEVKSFRQNG